MEEGRSARLPGRGRAQVEWRWRALCDFDPCDFARRGAGPAQERPRSFFWSSECDGCSSHHLCFAPGTALADALPTARALSYCVGHAWCLCRVKLPGRLRIAIHAWLTPPFLGDHMHFEATRPCGFSRTALVPKGFSVTRRVSTYRAPWPISHVELCTTPMHAAMLR